LALIPEERLKLNVRRVTSVFDEFTGLCVQGIDYMNSFSEISVHQRQLAVSSA
jgi:hypothetical protein